PRAGAQTVIAKGRPCVYLSRRHAVDRRRGCVVPLPRADTAREVLAFSPASEPTIVQERCMPSVPHAPAAGAATRDAVPTYTPEVAEATAPLYERVRHVIPEAEWPVHAPYIHEINRLKRERNAV